jgi:hypothetical protein
MGCVGSEDRAEMHILVKHAEAVRRALAISHVAASREREVGSPDLPALRAALGLAD